MSAPCQPTDPELAASWSSLIQTKSFMALQTGGARPLKAFAPWSSLPHLCDKAQAFIQQYAREANLKGSLLLQHFDKSGTPNVESNHLLWEVTIYSESNST